MQRGGGGGVELEEHEESSCQLQVAFVICVCLCLVAGVVFLVHQRTGKASFVVKVYPPTQCVVERPTTGNYVFDDQWHIPEDGPSDVRRKDCVSINEMNNSSTGAMTGMDALDNGSTGTDNGTGAMDIRMDEVVWAFHLPLKGMFEGRWVLRMEAYLQMDLLFRGNRSKDDLQRSRLTYEVRMAYQERKFGSSSTSWLWETGVETTQTRTLHCHLQGNGEPRRGVRYGCNLVPFFTMAGVHYKNYLLNLRFPNDRVGNSHFNRDVQRIRHIHLILRHPTPTYNRNYNMLRFIFWPISIGILAWFYRRLDYRPRLAIEKSCLFLGIALALFNIPLEFVSLFDDFPFMPLYTYAQEVIFIAALTLLCASFFRQFVKPRLEFRERVFYVFYLSPINLYLLVCLTDLYERFVQLRNPFFSIWDSIPGFRHNPEFNLFSALFSAFYLLVVTYQLVCLHRDISAEKVVMRYIRGHRFIWGGMRAVRFVMFGVFIVTFLTVLYFMYFQLEECAFKLFGPANPVARLGSSSCLTMFFVAVFGAWNTFTFTFLVMFAPKQPYHRRPGHEMDIFEVFNIWDHNIEREE